MWRSFTQRPSQQLGIALRNQIFGPSHVVGLSNLNCAFPAKTLHVSAIRCFRTSGYNESKKVEHQTPSAASTPLASNALKGSFVKSSDTSGIFADKSVPSATGGIGVEIGAGIKSFVRKNKNSTGYGPNTHRSKRAKNGLYHGKDVRFGHSISHSHTRSKRTWHPNVINKRVWSEGLEDWVRFKMTTAALRAIDRVGGIDNYVLGLDNFAVSESNYITKMRLLIATARYHKGILDEVSIRKLGFHRNLPPKISDASSSSTNSPQHQTQQTSQQV